MWGLADYGSVSTAGAKVFEICYTFYMENYHGILVNVSQKGNSIFNKIKIIGQKKAWGWILYKIEINTKEINRKINELQENMNDGFYFHLYKDDELIVIFKHKVFNVKTNKSTWKEVIDYGKSINIPKAQLDFYPCKIEDEKY